MSRRHHAPSRCARPSDGRRRCPSWSTARRPRRKRRPHPADGLTVQAAPLLMPQTQVTVADIAAAADALAAGADGWVGGFAARSAAGDHVGTHALLEVLRGRRPHPGPAAVGRAGAGR